MLGLSPLHIQLFVRLIIMAVQDVVRKEDKKRGSLTEKLGNWLAQSSSKQRLARSFSHAR